jgi:hypothetical protein
MMTHREPPKKVFALRLVHKDDSGNARYHALRAILKTLLRAHGFRCVDARELDEEQEPNS